MAYVARKLVTRAFNLSGVVSKELQTLEGDQAAEGLELLNDLLAENSTDTRLIPYFKKTEFDVEVGGEKCLWKLGCKAPYSHADCGACRAPRSIPACGRVACRSRPRLTHVFAHAALSRA